MTFGPARTFGIPTRQPLSNRRERGGALLLFTFMTILVIIPVIGLAIDGSILFWTKAKLSSAVDAAALAAGRSINVYETQQQNSGPVAAVAQEWFAANFPAGWLGTSVVGGAPTVTIAPTSTMTQTVVVTASATVPLYFMRLLHFSSATVAASAQSSRRNINLVLVLDRSGSMGPGGSNACPTMIASAQNFVNLFTDGFDTLGLVTFSTTANTGPIDYAPTTFFKSSTPTLNSRIGQIVCTGATSTAQALHVAYESIKSTGLAGGLNVIVFFTDGQPNLIVEKSWKIKTQTDTRNNPNPPWSSTSIGASPCNSSDVLSGGFTTLLASGTAPSNTGYTGGVYSTANTAITTAPGPITSASGCAFTNNGSTYARDDVAYIQNTDAYGNVTNSGYIGQGRVGAPDTFPSGPYIRKIRDDEQLNGVMAAAFAAADYQGQLIRNDTTYNTIIYTIGLDGAPDMGIDQVFLQRLANDPSSPIYDSTRPAGYYAYAADPSALSQAFHEIASQVLRLSK